MKYLFDAYAIIEIIKGNKNYRLYLSEDFTTSILNLGEIYYFLLINYGEKDADVWYNKLKDNVLFIDNEIIVKAMKFKFNNKAKNLSFVDSVSYILAKENSLIFLTGDREFRDMENVEFVK
mgnify:CR=1 FL=1